MTFLGDRISESLSGETAQVVVNLLGPDLDALEASAGKVIDAIDDIEGLTDLRMPRSATMPTLSVKLDRKALTNYGLTPQDALDTLETAFAGAEVGQTYAGARTVDVVMILPPELRNKLDTLRTLMVGRADAHARLDKVAEVHLSQGRQNIQHEGAERRVGVSFNGTGERSLSEIVEEAKGKIAAIDLPKDVYISWAGQAEAERQGQVRLALLTTLSVTAILASLAMAFRRRGLAALVS